MIALCLLVATTGAACDIPVTAPNLEDVYHAVDADRAIKCASKPTPAEKAKCLGVVAATAGLEIALKKAAELAEAARDAMGPAGADDMTDAQRQKLAADLRDSLDELGEEIAEANDAAAGASL